MELITLRVGDFTSAGTPGQSIPAAAFRCFNLGGTDFLGNPLVKEVRVAKGRVQPQWIGVQIPRVASGRFLGQIQLTAPGSRPVDVKVSITVAGEMLDDGGDSQGWRLSRLRWLDSTIGQSDEVGSSRLFRSKREVMPSPAD